MAFLLASCGGGGGSSSPTTAPTTGTTTPATTTSYTVPAAEALTTSDVGRVIAQAATEAQARGMPAVIAVTDRVGNVLAVFAMTGAKPNAVIPTPASNLNLDAQGLTVPATAAAIAKAITAAYLSSGGNAFTTRTASQITQPHFPPGPSGAGLESGPNFGMQFSQLPCSDLATRYGASGGAGALIGPKRSPLGIALDPGGVPLYKNGVLVGAIGVMGDGVYGFDPDQSDVDQSDEEYAALAGSYGFAAPDAITADKISLSGTSLRFLDATSANLKTSPAAAPPFATLNLGQLVAVRGYYGDATAPALLAGQVYGTEASGVRAATSAEFANGDAFVLTNGAGTDRYPIVGGSDGGAIAQPLTKAEVQALLEEAFKIMTRARAANRQPLDSRAQVSIAVVDTRGQPLGLVRSPDAPIFGADVALQKARTASFFSGANAGSDLSASASADIHGFVAAARGFLGDQAALTGKTAFTDRANGNLSRPTFPDGEDGRPNGPFSRPIGQFSPFSTGLQSALVAGNITAHLAYVTGVSATDTPQRCTDLPAAGTASRVANGIQVFPGSVPIYRGNVLVGGIGVSGDGVDQDDLIAFLGVYNAGVRVGSIANAPAAIRADQLVINAIRLRYVSCPFAPFLDTSDQDACSGK